MTNGWLTNNQQTNKRETVICTVVYCCRQLLCTVMYFTCYCVLLPFVVKLLCILAVRGLLLCIVVYCNACCVVGVGSSLTTTQCVNMQTTISKLLYQRLWGQLEQEQACDQVGFHATFSVDGACAVFDTVCGKSLEWNVPGWFANRDLRRAFDRVKYGSLFSALKLQGIDPACVSLLAMMYHDHTGSVSGSRHFANQSGVKQGDVISPLVFYAALELAIRNWKGRLSYH